MSAISAAGGGGRGKASLRNNEFSILDDEESSEGEGEQEPPKEEDALGRKLKSPRLGSYSSSSSQPSPRWTKITPPARRIPSLNLGSVSAPAAAAAAASSSSYEDGDDLSALSSLTVDSKGRRSSHRKAYGNKPNQFKALQQRIHNQAKRDVQRQANKPAAAAHQDQDDDYE